MLSPKSDIHLSPNLVDMSIVDKNDVDYKPNDPNMPKQSALLHDTSDPPSQIIPEHQLTSTEPKLDVDAHSTDVVMGVDTDSTLQTELTSTMKTSNAVSKNLADNTDRLIIPTPNDRHPCPIWKRKNTSEVSRQGGERKKECKTNFPHLNSLIKSEKIEKRLISRPGNAPNENGSSGQKVSRTFGKSKILANQNELHHHLSELNSRFTPLKNENASTQVRIHDLPVQSPTHYQLHSSKNLKDFKLKTHQLNPVIPQSRDIFKIFDTQDQQLKYKLFNNNSTTQESTPDNEYTSSATLAEEIPLKTFTLGAILT